MMGARSRDDWGKYPMRGRFTNHHQQKIFRMVKARTFQAIVVSTSVAFLISAFTVSAQQTTTIHYQGVNSYHELHYLAGSLFPDSDVRDPSVELKVDGAIQSVSLMPVFVLR